MAADGRLLAAAAAGPRPTAARSYRASPAGGSRLVGKLVEAARRSTGQDGATAAAQFRELVLKVAAGELEAPGLP